MAPRRLQARAEQHERTDDDDPVTVKDLLGHADLKTTERYLHAIRASELADAATRAFTPQAAGRDAADEAALETLIDKNRLGIA